ncbi:MAG: EH signature domain-containing protein [Shinella sp.]|uniref:EH signature domain-containing protein n=1 Tax=Shinella sp. TaxID=1870904 RepID=UPI003C70D94E
MIGLFREACTGMTVRASGLSGHDVIPKHAYVHEAALSIGATGIDDAARHDVVSINEIAARLLPLLLAGDALSTKELRDAIWCLWEARTPLADHPAALKRIVEEVDRSDKRKLFRTLAAVYLIQFRSDRPGLEFVSSTLQRGSLRWGGLFASYQNDHALYDPVRGPKNIAALALRQAMSPSDTMRSLGFGALDAQSGFTEAITRNLLVQLGDGAEPDHMKRLEMVRSYALDSRNELVFKGLDLEIAEALIKPFLGKPPEKAIKDIFLNFIVSIFKDPRTYPGRWERFPQIRALIVSWLTEQSLRQFLDIVGLTVKDPNDAQMWRYRRAFWEAAHRKGIIRGAWVVFAEDGARLARSRFGKNVDFATFVSAGSKPIQRTHAVLLLEVGQGIVADWSHNGKVNIWSDASERGAPKLYQRSYSSDDVTISKDDIETSRYLVKTHSSPKTYSWQRVVAERIYRMTNTRLQPNDYK